MGELYGEWKCSKPLPRPRSMLHMDNQAKHKLWGHLRQGVQVAVKAFSQALLMLLLDLLQQCTASLSSFMHLQYLVHFDTAMTSAEELTQQIQTAGGSVSSYIPEDTLVVVALSSQLSHLQQLAGVAWVGDYLPDYKIAPEAQRLSSFVTPESAAALLAQQHSADPTSAMSQTHPMSIFVHQAADGSAYARLDVAFPHHLPDMLGQLQTALELCDSSNSTRQRCHAQAVQQQLGSFHPAHAGATDWEAALNRLCDSRCSIAASGAERLVINVPVQHLQVTFQVEVC